MSRRLASGLVFLVLGATVAGAQFQDSPTRIPQGNPVNNASTYDVAIGDVDLDGDPDVLLANGGESGNARNRLWINQGGQQGGALGDFSDETDSRLPAVVDGSRAIELGDIDGDGDLDAHVSNLSTVMNQPCRWWVNRGGMQNGPAGYFVDETDSRWVGLGGVGSSVPANAVLPSGGWVTWSASSALADLDADGDLDLVQGSLGGGLSDGGIPTRVFLNDGAGYFSEFNPSGYQLVSPYLPLGAPGLWCEGVQQHATTNATGTFCDVAPAAVGISVADVDGDLDLDILLGDWGGAPRLIVNRLAEQGALGFRDVSGSAFALHPAGGQGRAEQELVDLDCDGDVDIVGVDWAITPSTFRDAVLTNDGTGVFGAAVLLPTSSADDTACEPIDADADGDLDLYFTSWSNDRFYVNAGCSTIFTQPSGSYLPTMPFIGRRAAAVDVDGDGDADILVANDDFRPNQLLLNLSDVPDYTAPVIPLVETAADRVAGESSTVIRAHVYDNASLESLHGCAAWLSVKLDGVPLPPVPMRNSGGQVWRGEIPGYLAGAVEYRVSARDAAGNVGESAAATFVSTIGNGSDCNGNGILDAFELAANDCDNNGVPDECDPDTDQDGVPDACESPYVTNADSFAAGSGTSSGGASSRGTFVGVDPSLEPFRWWLAPFRLPWSGRCREWGLEEDDDFGGWTCRHGAFTDSTPPLVDCDLASPNVVTGSTLDPNVPMPQTSPRGGMRSIRIGNDASGAQRDAIERSFTVDNVFRELHLDYALVLQDPGHAPSSQPAFRVRIWTDGTLRHDFQKVSSSSDPFFTIFNGLAWRDWSCAVFDLSPWTGETGLIRIEVSDCALGAHYGYAYVDFPCWPEEASLQLRSSYCGSEAILANGGGNVGVLSHCWTVREVDAIGNVIAGTQETVCDGGDPHQLDVRAFYLSHGRELEHGARYEVQLEVTTECGTRVASRTFIYGSSPIADAGPDLCVCPVGSGTSLTAVSYDPDLVYQWRYGSGFPFHVGEWVNVYPTQTTTYTLRVVDPATGCSATDTVTVHVQEGFDAHVEACICGDEVTLTAVVTGACPTSTTSFSWGSGQTTPSITVSRAAGGTYYVSIFQGECTRLRSFDVGQLPPRQLAAPTAFAPDGTNRFNVFHVGLAAGEAPAYYATEWRFEIWDRWGILRRVMSGSFADCAAIPNGTLPSWDGTANGVFLENGEYLTRFFLGCGGELEWVPLNGQLWHLLTYLQ